MSVRLQVKCLLFSTDFNETRIFWKNFRKKNTQILNFMKIRRMGGRVTASRQTDRHDDLMVDLRKFCENTKKKNAS